jgi:hypothetical protein
MGATSVLRGPGKVIRTGHIEVDDALLTWEKRFDRQL